MRIRGRWVGVKVNEDRSGDLFLIMSLWLQSKGKVEVYQNYVFNNYLPMIFYHIFLHLSTNLPFYTLYFLYLFKLSTIVFYDKKHRIWIVKMSTCIDLKLS